MQAAITPKKGVRLETIIEGKIQRNIPNILIQLLDDANMNGRKQHR